MNIKQISKMAAMADRLTEKQRHRLAKAIKENPEAREIAARGAFMSGNFGLFVQLTTVL